VWWAHHRGHHQEAVRNLQALLRQVPQEELGRGRESDSPPCHPEHRHTTGAEPEALRELLERLQEGLPRRVGHPLRRHQDRQESLQPEEEHLPEEERLQPEEHLRQLELRREHPALPHVQRHHHPDRADPRRQQRRCTVCYRP
jgi:hypothetical protein